MKKISDKYKYALQKHRSLFNFNFLYFLIFQIPAPAHSFPHYFIPGSRRQVTYRVIIQCDLAPAIRLAALRVLYFIHVLPADRPVLLKCIDHTVHSSDADFIIRL